MRSLPLGGVVLASTMLACESPERAVYELPVVDECQDRRDGVLCSEDTALTCAGGRIASRRDCARDGLICADGDGCRVCDPYGITCEGDQRFRCNRDGSARELVEVCSAGLSCSPSGCRDLCADAAADRSYLGCEYRPVFTANHALDPQFFPAVSIGNGNLVPASVVITRGDETITREVPPRSSITVELAYQTTLRDSRGSTLVRGGAYVLRASVPVTVHQFNPLLYSLPVKCTEGYPQTGGVCFSYSNDASLLLPAAALAPAEGESHATYLVASRPSFVFRASTDQAHSGFVTIVALGERPVRVAVSPSAHIAGSIAGDLTETIEARAPGQVLERVLAPGDVLQLLSDAPPACQGATAALPRAGTSACDYGRAYDLTGTEIRADGPVQVLAGHDCANVPFDRVACDHLEESMVPLRAWGTRTVVTAPRVAPSPEYLLRVISGADQNTIRFDPPIREPVVLARGEFVEIAASRHVVVTGSGRLMVAQYLVGQGQFLEAGDPSQSFSVPVDQYRSTYNFQSPATYDVSYLDIIATTGDVVKLDGKLVSSFVPVGDSGFAVASVKLERAGAHELTSASGRGLGAVLYGVGSFTSYMLPIGLDLRPIGDPVI